MFDRLVKSEVENDTEGIMDAAGSMHPAATAGLDYYSYVFGNFALH